MNAGKKMSVVREKVVDIRKIGLLALVLVSVAAHVSYAEIDVKNSPVCMDLMAGQHTDAGNICVEVVDDQLLVTYVTTGGWELIETHFWVGAELADMPRTKKGNPKIGHFPYHSPDITGRQRYQFFVPLTDLAEGNIYTALCNKTFLAAAHAELRIADGEGGYQTESGWANGTPIVPKGNWGMYFDFEFVCGEIPPVIECETAFTYGDKALWDILDPGGNPITDEWGWQITVYPGDRVLLPIYTDAIDNDPGNGTHVGFVYLSYSGTWVQVEYFTFSPYSLSDTNLYVGTGETSTADPAQFGHNHTLPPNDRTDAYRIAIVGSQIYVVAHATVCETVNVSGLYERNDPN